MRSGVARIQVATCTSSSSGSGLVVGRNLVLTAAHVVHGARSITVGLEGTTASGGRQVSRADVVGIDRSADLALVRTTRPLTGHVFALATADPSIGDEIALIGYPFGDPLLSAKFGRVSDLGRSGSYADDAGRSVAVSRLFTSDAASNPGNSGGPVILRDGAVVGVVFGQRLTHTGEPAEGMGMAASTGRSAALIRGWRSRAPIGSVVCADGDERGTGAGDEEDLAVSITSRHSQAAIVAESLALHGTAINEGQYSVAYDLFTRAMQRRMGGVATWSRSLTTSRWQRLEVRDITTVSARRLQVLTTLQTEQDAAEGPDGQTCSIWSLDYAMVMEAGVWHIDKAQAHGVAPQPC